MPELQDASTSISLPSLLSPPQSPEPGFDENKLALSGSPSQSFETDDGLTLSSGISGRFVSEYTIGPVNCDGHWIAAGKRQFERLVEKRVNPMVFLPFRVGARGLRV